MTEDIDVQPRHDAASPATPVRLDPPDDGPEVRQDPPADVPEPERKPNWQARVQPARLNVRQEPGGEVVSVLPQGATVTVEDEADGWLKIADGWVMAKFVS